MPSAVGINNRYLCRKYVLINQFERQDGHQRAASRRTSDTPSNGQSIRQFLGKFKTKECGQKEERCRDPYQCEYYHDASDRRRSPYLKNCIVYSPELCCELQCKDYHNCARAHNQMEVEFHPLKYLTSRCNKFYGCDRLVCPHLHEKQLQNMPLSCFFRFDLNTFKTTSCCLDYQHDLKTCLYFHNSKDRRRPHLNYEHIPCDKYDKCEDGDNCRHAHNKIQQLYHPSRYKSKFCQKYPSNLHDCQYKEFCSFAHSKAEITITLIHQKELTADFMINYYKTVWCPYTNTHDRKNCVYAHNVQDFRRAPSQYNYQPEACPNWSTTKTLKSIEMGGCKLGMECNKCHGWKELEYHPLKYGKSKTKKYPTGKMYDTPNCQKEQIIKKLNEKGAKNNTFHNKIEPVILTHYSPAMVGAPFFQHDRDLSVSDKPGKQHYRGSCSDVDARDKNKASKRRESVDSFEPEQKRKLITFAWNYYSEERESFDCFMDKGGPAEIERSTRSCGKKSKKPLEISYSRSLAQLFEGTHILQLLKQNQISEIKLLNLSPNEIEKLSYLEPEQKASLISRLNEYNSKSEHSVVYYSVELTQYFKKHNRQYILEYMRKKRVKEQKFLVLQEEQIQILSFIEEEDKKLLPKLIKEFNDNKDFSDLNSMISLHTTISNSTNGIDQSIPST